MAKRTGKGQPVVNNDPDQEFVKEVTAPPSRRRRRTSIGPRLTKNQEPESREQFKHLITGTMGTPIVHTSPTARQLVRINERQEARIRRFTGRG